MTWWTLAWKDWQRRPLRTGVTVAGVAIAIAALFSLLAFQQGYRDGVRHELDQLGADVLVVPKGCPYDAASIALHGASWPCYLNSAYLDGVRGTPGVRTAAPVFMTASYDDAGDQVVYEGVEQSILALKPAWRIRGQFPEHRGELLIGANVAQQRHWAIGQTVSLPEAHGAAGTVSGILTPTHWADDGFIFLRLDDAQRLFGHPQELTHILVRLADPDDLDTVVSQLRGCDAGLSMNVVPLAHLFHTIQSLVNSTRVLLGCVALVALLVAGTGVSNTVLMAVAERTREIGVMRAVGASRPAVFGLVWIQTIQVCLAGGAAGIILAWTASRTVEAWLRTRLPFAPMDALVRFEGWVALACIAAALVLGSIAGFLPAWRAAGLSPVVAIRTRGGAV